MNAKLKFTASQYEGFYTCVNNAIRMLDVSDLITYTYFGCLRKLSQKICINLHNLKDKRVTLSDLETIAVYHAFNNVYSYLHPYEKAIADITLRSIYKQADNEIDQLNHYYGNKQISR